MSKKDYERFARIFHNAMHEHPDDWKVIYDQIYGPFVAYLQEENSDFNATTFGYAVGTGVPQYQEVASASK